MSAALKLARMVLAGHPDAHRMAARLVTDDLGRARRVKTKRAPRIARERATKAQRRDNLSRTRDIVWARADGICEVCRKVEGVHLHHLYFGRGSRRTYEGPNACACACEACHRAIHRNDPDTLALVRSLAAIIDAPDRVQASLTGRLDKVRE